MQEFPTVHKETIHNAYDMALDHFVALQREPRPEEERCLVRALALMAADSYSMAAEELLPLTRLIRASSGLAEASQASHTLCTLPMLRKGLVRVRAMV
jgi:hypothetical protein